MTLPLDQSTPAGEEPLLRVHDLNVSYGRVHVLQDVTFDVGREPLGILGRNGMGKTTLVNALVGLVPAQSGRVDFEGATIFGRTPYRINRAGIAYVPQGRRIFPSLTVHEHLTMIGATRGARWDVEGVYELFPRLEERRRSGAGDLSGGEQQMLAIGRALLSNPRLIIMDEPSEGLAPSVVDHLAGVFKALVDEGKSVLLVEQNLRFATELCERILIMVNGRIAVAVTAEELAADPELQARHLGIT